MKKGLTLTAFLFNLLLFLQACNENPPVTPTPPIELKDTIIVTIEDVTHRSITVNVQSTVNNPQSAVRLYRLLNSSEGLVAEYPITVEDTTIIDDDNGTGLLLDTTYTYYAVRVDSTGALKDTSGSVTARTLAPTTHNYTWQEFTIGEFQSALYDVWGTDENNVYACGGGNHKWRIL